MIVKLQGGMANQCFQVAYGLSESAKRGEEVFFDRSTIVPPRYYALEPFNLDLKFKDDCPDAEVGYWQSEKWFDGNLARRLFSDPDPGPPRIAVAMHVRLTDYLNTNSLAFHGNLLETDYYDHARNYMRSRLTTPYFLIFSDDPGWCRKHLQRPDSLVLPEAPAHEDLWRMARCPYAIIANSSFSWWGAYLGAQKIVVAPKRWFVVPVPGAEDIVPSRWVTI